MVIQFRFQNLKLSQSNNNLHIFKIYNLKNSLHILQDIFKMRFLTFLLSNFMMFYSSKSLHICGNYCGPSWCNGQHLNEALCDESVPSETHIFTGTSCADDCCKIHDRCCGLQNKSSCNTDIITCLQNCDSESLTCTSPYGFPINPSIIESAMEVIEDWCCGSPCT